MTINGKTFNVEQAMHNIAMEWARRDLDNELAKPRKESGLDLSDPTSALNFLFDSYVQAFGYLSERSDESIKDLLQHH